MRTRWIVGDEECPSTYVSPDGLRLDIPCKTKNDRKTVRCEVEFRGGVVNKTIGEIQVNESALNKPAEVKSKLTIVMLLFTKHSLSLL